MTVRLAIDGSVATMMIARPQAMNSLDPEATEALFAACDRISEDDGIRVAILTGEGSRAFCTGSDLKTPPPKESFVTLYYGRSKRSSLASLAVSKPLIAAINGYCLGGGLELALQCDIRVASDNASFGLPEVRIGSIPGAGGTQRLIRSIGRSDAMLMLLTGERADAQEALRIGLVSRVFPQESLMASTIDIARRIAANAPLAVAAVKKLAVEGSEVPLATGLEIEQQAFGLLRDTADRLEGRRAFAAKETPVFTGR